MVDKAVGGEGAVCRTMFTVIGRLVIPGCRDAYQCAVGSFPPAASKASVRAVAV
jgi:hypothetical protein